ncbi:biopolymer transporter ExbD [Verrucomicrobium sp. BvORR034]|jgi:biopolymer transport protein ExbD|uniref:ExbD/TolR family protein n=1 Tax=Verrucomicrobium sp. BvORR034 TaxID=1396418 RepID=UPI0006794A79|nr:biopolymer transporter ExbD [Verrucomicrobium sp. BvORR034]
MKFRNVSKIEPIPLQLAPLIDILLLLLLFFIITMNFAKQETEIEIAVPAAEEGKENTDRTYGEIVINVKKDGVITMEGQTLTGDQLLTKLKLIASVQKDQAVILRSDENSLYKFTINVLDVCQKAGIWNVSFATRPPESDAPGGAPPSAPAPSAAASTAL